MAAPLKTHRFIWGVVLTLVTVVALASYYAGSRYLGAVHAVEHSLSVKLAINGTLLSLTDAETGQRGYVLTGDEQFLEPYESARRELPALDARLRAITRGDAEQSAHLTALDALIQRKMTYIAETIRLRRAGGDELAPGRVRSGGGKRIMDAIRAQSQGMLKHEQALLEARESEAHTAKLAAIWGVGGGMLLTVLVALASFVTVQRDAEALRRTAGELAASEEHYRQLAEQSSDLVRLLDRDGSLTYVSPSVSALLGYTVDEFVALDQRAILHPDDREQASELHEALRSGVLDEGIVTYRLRRRSGEYRWFEVRWAARRDADGHARDVHTSGRDVTERVETERKLSAYAKELLGLSLRDELTGLYNRRGFLEVATRAYDRAVQDRCPAALLFVDLNEMKSINDAQGHDAGDRAIADAALVIQGAVRETDVVARLGGDEFVAFMLDFTEKDLDPLRRRLRRRADERVAEERRPFRLSMSVGAAYLPVGSPLGLSELLDEADAAMYEQKNARRAAGGTSLVPPEA